MTMLTLMTMMTMLTTRAGNEQAPPRALLSRHRAARQRQQGRPTGAAPATRAVCTINAARPTRHEHARACALATSTRDTRFNRAAVQRATDNGRHQHAPQNAH